VNTNQTFIEDLRLVDLPAWWQNPWNWLIIAAIASALVFAFRRWKKAGSISLKAPKPSPPGPPPHVAALARLDELRKRHAKLTAYQVALECSDILRRYIEARFQSQIRYQTTREFLGAAHISPELSADSQNELGAFLEFFDALKFAQETAPPDRTAEAINQAERFVQKCIPHE
jgi:hypothetical protein